MKLKMLLATTAASLVLSAGMAFAGPEMVSGPGAEPECFAPWSGDTKYMQWEAKEGPYKMAVVNGFVGNGWRIQMSGASGCCGLCRVVVVGIRRLEPAQRDGVGDAVHGLRRVRAELAELVAQPVQHVRLVAPDGTVLKCAAAIHGRHRKYEELDGAVAAALRRSLATRAPAHAAATDTTND